MRKKMQHEENSNLEIGFHQSLNQMKSTFLQAPFVFCRMEITGVMASGKSTMMQYLQDNYRFQGIVAEGDALTWALCLRMADIPTEDCKDLQLQFLFNVAYSKETPFQFRDTRGSDIHRWTVKAAWYYNNADEEDIRAAFMKFGSELFGKHFEYKIAVQTRWGGAASNIIVMVLPSSDVYKANLADRKKQGWGEQPKLSPLKFAEWYDRAYRNLKKIGLDVYLVPNTSRRLFHHCIRMFMDMYVTPSFKVMEMINVTAGHTVNPYGLGDDYMKVGQLAVPKNVSSANLAMGTYASGEISKLPGTSMKISKRKRIPQMICARVEPNGMSILFKQQGNCMGVTESANTDQVLN